MWSALIRVDNLVNFTRDRVRRRGDGNYLAAVGITFQCGNDAAAVKRDPEGRQIVTVDTSSGFEIEIPLIDFDRLMKEATNIRNFLNAISAPMQGWTSGVALA
jgi:hypothetical protein